jgi:hypothetical protein
MSSCIIQFVTGNEYDSLSKEDKKKIVKLESFDLITNENIYEITGNQLLTELEKHDKSLVYLYSNGCKSENCLSLNFIENYAKENNYKLFLVMNSYYKLNESTNQNIKSVLFAINNDSYDLKKSHKYSKIFKTELGYYTVASKKEYRGGYMFFKKDEMIEIKMNLE